MKVLHVHPSMKGGGIEAMICALANEMSKSADVTVCSIFECSDTDVFWNKLNSSVTKFSLGKKGSGFSFRILVSLLQTIKRGKYDVVNIHGMFYYYVLPIFLLQKKSKFFYTVHSDAKMENTQWDSRLFFLKKWCFRNGFVHPITISNASQNSFYELYGCSSSLIYNGVPKPMVGNVDLVKEYRFTSKTRVFIHAGRIDTPKNQLVLCKVFKMLIDEGNDVVLLIAGAKQNEQIFDSIKAYFCNRIIYLGERSDIPQLMSFCDAMCLPSVWEGLPVTLLEALSVGCVPICTNVGGIHDVIRQGINGFLSDTPSEVDFCLAVKNFLLLSREECLRIERNCKQSFSKYDIVNTSVSYINTYKSI